MPLVFVDQFDDGSIKSVHVCTSKADKTAAANNTHWGGLKNIFTKVCESLWEFYKAKLTFD